MQVKKNLVVSIDEEGALGEKDVLSFRTTTLGKVVVEAAASKLVLNPEAIRSAFNEVETFLANNSDAINLANQTLDSSKNSLSSSNTPLFIEGDDS